VSKIIQGHRLLCQSNAGMRLYIVSRVAEILSHILFELRNIYRLKF